MKSRRARSPRRPKLSSRLFKIVPSLLLGGALLLLAGPRTIAAWSGLEALPAFENLWAGKTPTDGELSMAASGLTRAVAAAPSGEKLVDLGAVELLQAFAPDLDKAQRAGLLARSEQHVTEGLVANPTHAFGWLKLAEARIARGAGGRDVAAVLMHSVDVAPYMRLAWIPRTRLLLRYWRSLEGDELPSFIAQLRTIWSATPAYRSKLIETAIEVDEMEIVAAAIAEPPPTADALKEIQTRQALRGRPR